VVNTFVFPSGRSALLTYVLEFEKGLPFRCVSCQIGSPIVWQTTFFIGQRFFFVTLSARTYLPSPPKPPSAGAAGQLGMCAIAAAAAGPPQYESFFTEFSFLFSVEFFFS